MALISDVVEKDHISPEKIVNLHGADKNSLMKSILLMISTAKNYGETYEDFIAGVKKGVNKLIKEDENIIIRSEDFVVGNIVFFDSRKNIRIGVISEINGNSVTIIDRGCEVIISVKSIKCVIPETHELVNKALDHFNESRKKWWTHL